MLAFSTFSTKVVNLRLFAATKVAAYSRLNVAINNLFFYRTKSLAMLTFPNVVLYDRVYKRQFYYLIKLENGLRILKVDDV